MIILTIGVILWVAGHMLPVLAPDLRARLVNAVGAGPYRGLYSLDALLGLALIVIGYRSADWIGVYDPPAWSVHANNTLMLIAIYLMGVGGAKAWLGTKLRHPMLTGVAVWAVAHLLANGDMASLVLFGAMLIWSIAMMIAINRRDGAWTPPEARGLRAEIILVGVTLALFIVIALVHYMLLGVNPFPS